MSSSSVCTSATLSRPNFALALRSSGGEEVSICGIMRNIQSPKLGSGQRPVEAGLKAGIFSSPVRSKMASVDLVVPTG